MNSLIERYPDLLGDRPDREVLRLADHLDLAYATSIPADRDAAIARLLAHHSSHRHVPGGGPVGRLRHPLAAVAALAVALVVLVGGVYAGASLIDQAFFSTPSGGQVVEHNLGQSVNLSQSRCGFTMTVGKVYADPHRVLIAYTLQGPEGRTFFGGVPDQTATPTLQDGQGYQLLPAEGSFAPGSFGSKTGDLLAFETNLGTRAGSPMTRWLAVPAGPVSLRLTVPAIQMTERYDQPAPPGQPCERYSRVGQANGHWWRDVTVEGPFIFAFTVPISNDLRTADLHQSSGANGVSVTLDRVAIAPSEMRVYWHDNLGHSGPALTAELAGPALPSNSPPVTRLLTTQLGGQIYWRGFYIGSNNGLRTYTFDLPAYDYHGPWTLLVFTKPGQEGVAQTPPSDNLTFHFQVP